MESNKDFISIISKKKSFKIPISPGDYITKITITTKNNESFDIKASDFNIDGIDSDSDSDSGDEVENRNNILRRVFDYLRETCGDCPYDDPYYYFKENIYNDGNGYQLMHNTRSQMRGYRSSSFNFNLFNSVYHKELYNRIDIVKYKMNDIYPGCNDYIVKTKDNYKLVIKLQDEFKNKYLTYDYLKCFGYNHVAQILHSKDYYDGRFWLDELTEDFETMMILVNGVFEKIIYNNDNIFIINDEEKKQILFHFLYEYYIELENILDGVEEFDICN